MALQRSSAWPRRLVVIGLLLITATSASELSDASRTTPAWEILLLPVSMYVGAASLWVHQLPRLSSQAQQRWSTALGALSFALALLALYVRACVRGACVAI